MIKQRKPYERTKKTLYSLFEIFTLVLSIVSFSFIVGCLTNEIKNVSAAEGIRCCYQAKDGSMCQEYGTKDCAGECETGCIPTECAAIPDCATGCCFDQSEGFCTPNSMRGECTEQGGAWHPDASCEVNECRQGCCVLGTEAQFVTRTRCDRLSELYGIVSEFKSDFDELTCYETAGESEIGACITGEDIEGKSNCKFTSRADCIELTGSSRKFYKNYLCSNEELNTNCERQKTTGCVDGRDEVYWFDSCGNRENIYSSNKEQSWSSGKVLDKQQSCNPGSSNANSATCGNCNYELGGICRKYNEELDKTKPREGDYICRDLNCYDAPKMGGKQDRINGESWCVYDGIVGDGRDLVGSRHFRYVCIDGETEVEPCADYRQEICVQDSKTLDNGREIDEAMCRANMWEDCFTKNDEEGCKESCIAECTLNPDCKIHPVKVSEDLEFALCVPKYPSGFRFDSSFVTSSAGAGQTGSSEIGLEGVESYVSQQENVDGHICGLGSQSCTYVEQKTLSGWVCIRNCQCKNSLTEAAVKMNDLCTNLGDCGIYPNFKGTTTLGGFSVSGAGLESSILGAVVPAVFAAMIGNAGRLAASTERGGEVIAAVPGFYDDIADIDDLPIRGISQIFGYGMGGSDPRQSEDGGWFGMFTGPGSVQAFALTGAAGIAGIGGAALFGSAAPIAAGTPLAAGTYVSGTIQAGSTTFVASSTAPVTITQGTGGLVVGQSGGATVGMQAGASPTATTAVTPVGGPALTTLLFWAVVAIAVIIIAMNLIGIGDIKETEVKFSCLPWQQPAIRSDCSYCNEDPYKPCSKYRCESLGTRCVMITDNSEEYGACINKEGEDTVPMISPWEDALNKSMFKYVSAGMNGFQIRALDGKCVPAFSIVSFGVETDVYASCKIATDKEMSDALPFLDGTGYRKNHSMIVSTFPSADAIMDYLESREIDAEIDEATREAIELQLADINFYVKCGNLDGEENLQDFKINICVDDGPDLTPPLITGTSPVSGSFVAYNATEKEVTLLVNEIAECRWSETLPIGTPQEKFESLENEIQCEQDIYSGGIFGYECKANLPVMENETKYYIMCKDQPWLEDESLRNIGSVFEYLLRKSPSALTIVNLEPSGTIDYGGAEFPQIELLAKTAGGASNGFCTCKFSFDGKQYTEFLETKNTNHKQVFTSLSPGQNTIYVFCKDGADNVAFNQTSFELAKDNSAPIVTRTYGSGSSLIFLTNENALCYYHNDTSRACNFGITNVSATSGIATKFHEVPWDNDATYYIRCADSWGNQEDGCSIIIKPYKERTG